MDIDNNKEDINYNIGIFDPDGKNNNPFNDKPYSDTYKNLSKFWSNLPAYSMAEIVVKSIIKNDVLLVISGTGSGKTVLVPKFCLHATNYKGRIIVTLPKKIITKKAAEFSAKTLDVELGEQVGYQFRGENLKSKKTNLLYSTDGSIISQIKKDPLLRRIDIVIIDEAHERKVQIDLLLYLIKNAIKMRKEKNMKPLKLIIMSATINEEMFKKYYSEFNYDSLFLSGTPNFPIESIYLESPLDIKTNKYLEEGQNIIKNIINKININDSKFPDGDILFFVCTVLECEQISEKLSETLKDCFIMPLYSGFNPDLEQYISSPDKYKELNKKFKRRIFISTNVAESSLTIDGIVYVIDSGLEISVKFDPTKNINIMTKNFITKAQMTQRKGRAGRTKPGIAYHLYTPKEQEDTINFPEPEIRKIDIKNTCLSLLKLGNDINQLSKSSTIIQDNVLGGPEFNIEDVINMFMNFIEPPGEPFITNGFDFAIKHNLIDFDMKLSKEGELVIESKLDIQDALTLLYAWNISLDIFQKVFKIICICSQLKSGINDLFYHDIDKKKRTKIIEEFKKDSLNSEHILLYKIYEKIEKNKSRGIFNYKLYDSIKHLYDKQYTKLEEVYKKYDIKIDIDSDTKTNTIYKNIIYSFNYGYRGNRSFRRGNIFKYNEITCDTFKSAFNFNKYNSIIFYLNLHVNGRLNLMICSPYLLK